MLFDSMHKGVIAYIIILILLVIFAYYLYQTSRPVSKPIHVVTTIKNTTITTTTTQTTTVNSSLTKVASCLSSSPVVAIPNGNFSSGTYADWVATGYGFGSAPLNLTWANEKGDYYGAPWSGFGNNTFAATTFQKGLAIQPGNLTSKPFEVVLPFLNFKIISPLNNLVYIEILKDNKPAIVAHFNTYAVPGNINAQSTFENASIFLGNLLCQNVSIRVVFVGTGLSTTQFIAVTGFYLSSKPVSAPNVTVNETVV